MRGHRGAVLLGRGLDRPACLVSTGRWEGVGSWKKSPRDKQQERILSCCALTWAAAPRAATPCDVWGSDGSGLVRAEMVRAMTNKEKESLYKDGVRLSPLPQLPAPLPPPRQAC